MISRAGPRGAPGAGCAIAGAASSVAAAVSKAAAGVVSKVFLGMRIALRLPANNGLCRRVCGRRSFGYAGAVASPEWNQMKTSKWTATFLAAVVLAALPWFAAAQIVRPEQVGLSAQRLERIGELVDRHVEAGDITGAVTLVAKDGRIAHLEAHARRISPRTGR
jgi:hypothetical protein